MSQTMAEIELEWQNTSQFVSLKYLGNDSYLKQVTSFNNLNHFMEDLQKNFFFPVLILQIFLNLSRQPWESPYTWLLST